MNPSTTTEPLPVMQPPTALVIDDSAIQRSMLKRILTEAGFRIVGEAATAEGLVRLYEHHRPDLVTLDIVMPGIDGATAAAELLASHPEATIVMCTSLTTREKILACQRAGVRHYLLKPIVADRAVQIFRHVVPRPRSV